jgi:hypothetical protein
VWTITVAPPAVGVPVLAAGEAAGVEIAAALVGLLALAGETGLADVVAAAALVVVDAVVVEDVDEPQAASAVAKTNPTLKSANLDRDIERMFIP